MNALPLNRSLDSIMLSVGGTWHVTVPSGHHGEGGDGCVLWRGEVFGRRGVAKLVPIPAYVTSTISDCECTATE